MGDLVDAQASGVPEAQEEVVSSRACFLDRRAATSWRLLRGGEQLEDVALGQDALGQGVLQLGPLDDATDVEGQVAEVVAAAEQRLHRRDFARPRAGGEMVEGVHPGLDIADADRTQRLSHEAEELSTSVR